MEDCLHSVLAVLMSVGSSFHQWIVNIGDFVERQQGSLRSPDVASRLAVMEHSGRSGVYGLTMSWALSRRQPVQVTEERCGVGELGEVWD